MNRRRYLRSVVVGSTSILAGCPGSESGDEATPTATPTEPANDEETPTPTAGDGTPVETPAETSTPEPPDDPDQRVLVGDGLQFDPESFEIAVGDTVLWEWVGGGHNLKYDEGDVPKDTNWGGTRGARTKTYGEGHVHWHTFEVAGRYDYYCVPHRSNGMRGSFTVSG